MKIKTKLNLSVGLLFVMIIILSLVGSYYIFQVKKDTQNILTANYNTLEYSRNMLLALDAIGIDEKKAVSVFEKNLAQQMANITEAGEDKVTGSLQRSFLLLKKDIANESIKNQIRQDIFEIMKLNMRAIKDKADLAKITAETANIWIAVIGTFCFLIAFNLMVNLPNNIANPIRELTEFMNHNEFGDLAKSFNTMAQKLQEYHNSNLYKLSFEKKRLETLINNTHDPIIGLDTDNIVLFVNDEALKILGLKRAEAIGKSATALAASNDLLQTLIHESGNDKQPLKIYADGKESYFEKEVVGITITPTGEDQTIAIGNVIILRNITIFKELDFAKTNFIATVSHELKTPIASIKLSLQLLEQANTGKLNDGQRQLIDSIADDSQRLLKITGELLELSQVETGNIQLNIDKSDPQEIVNYAVEAVKVQAEQKQIEIVVESGEKLPQIKADHEKTSWVLINFLTNAIRYSAEGSKIWVQLKTEQEKVIFKVVDKGKGIDSRYKTKVFDKYFQVPGSPKTGTGLGLAISKEFIEAQHGTIGVESELGMGSTFYFLLTMV